MDNFEWCNQAAEMNSQHNGNNNADNNTVDLTLKIGLPLPRFHQNPSLYHNNQQGSVNQGATNIEGRQNFNGSQYAWPSDQMGNSSTVHNMNYGNVFNHFSGPSIRYPSYNTTSSYNNFAPSALPPPHTGPPTGYTLLDVPPRRAAANQRQRELGNSSASGLGRQGQGSQRFGTYNDPNKRCTNYNCNTNDTPMWRKGPLGPKTLCNACGIKYRKEKEKRREKEKEAEAEAEEEVYRPILMDE